MKTRTPRIAIARTSATADFEKRQHEQNGSTARRLEVLGNNHHRAAQAHQFHAIKQGRAVLKSEDAEGSEKADCGAEQPAAPPTRRRRGQCASEPRGQEAEAHNDRPSGSMRKETGSPMIAFGRTIVGLPAGKLTIAAKIPAATSTTRRMRLSIDAPTRARIALSAKQSGERQKLTDD